MKAEINFLVLSTVMLAAALCVVEPSVVASQELTGFQLLRKQAVDLQDVVQSDLAKTFLQSAAKLSKIPEREIYVHKDNRRTAISVADAKTLDPAELARFKKVKLNEQFYYFTRYGSPLAFGLAS